MKVIIRKRYLLILIALLLLFGELLDSKIHYFFGYADEIIATVGFFIIIYNFSSKRIYIDMVRGFFLLAMLLLLGIISSFFSDIKFGFFANALDAFAFSKFLLIFWMGIIMSENAINTQRNWGTMALVIRIFVFIAFIFCIINLFIDIDMYTDYRYGLRAFNFVFSRVGGLYTSCVGFLMIQAMDISYNGNSWIKRILLIMTIIVMCSTLRARAFSYAAIFIVGFLIIQGKYRLRLWHLVVVTLVGIIIAFPQFRFYFIDNANQARNVLLKYGIITAIAYFPLGSGFSTYGTYMASRMGSSLYSRYKFYNYYGLGRVNKAYLTDTYWPAIIAEFGFLGGIIMFAIIMTIIIYSYKKLKHGNKMILFSVMYLLITTAASSIATASFITDTSYFFLAAIAIGEINREVNKNKTNYNLEYKEV